MSWLTDLAGKAEGLLNQIDQSAANTLTKEKGSRHSTPSHHVSHPLPPSYSEPGDYMSPKDQLGSLDFAPTRKDHRSSGYASSVSSMSTREQQVKETEDEKLLAYLNEGGVAEEGQSTGHLSRRSSTSSLRSLPTALFLQPHEQVPPPTTPTQTTDAHQSSSPQKEAEASQKKDFSFRNRLEREVVELKAREVDLQKALQAKDSQLAVLRVRLQETDQLLESRTKILSSLKTEKDRLLKDSAESTEIRNKALGTMQSQLKEAETEFERETQNAKRTETELMARIHRLEEESSALARQLTEVQKKSTEEKLKAKDASDQLRLAKYNLEANKSEFDEYKQKAQRILQAKEKLIETLKAGGGGLGEGEGGSLAVELEELRSERDILKEDYQQTQLQIYNLKTEIQEVESQLAAEQRSALETQRDTQEQCQNYQNSARQYQEQHDHLKLEYQYLQDELRRQQVTLQTKLQEKDAEIFRLMNQNTARSINVSQGGDYEQRIRHLTENLIQKQTLIESLQTERNALALQLERLERMYKEAESAAIRNSSTVIPMMEEGSVSSRIPSFLRESPYDTQVAKGVKRAYGTMDTLRYYSIFG